MPKIDDELAKKSGAFATLKELREDIKKNLKIQADRDATEKYKDDLLVELVKSSKTEAPKTLVDEQVEHIKEDMERNLKTRGMSIEDYLKMNEQTEAEWLAEIRQAAERRVISSIIVQKLADELKVEVSEEEVEKQAAEMRAVYRNDENAVKQLNDPRVISSIHNRMRVNRTMDMLVELNREHAKVVKVPAFPKQEAKATKKPAKKAAAKKSK